MRSSGLLIAIFGWVLLPLSSVRGESRLHAADDPLPPKPANTPADGSKPKSQEKPLPLRTPVVPPSPSVSIDANQQAQTNPNVQNTVPPVNTLPNLAANSNVSAAPNFFGDYFNPGAGMTLTVPGSPIGSNPLAIGIVSTDPRNSADPFQGAHEYFRQIIPGPNIGQWQTLPTSNLVYEGIPSHISPTGNPNQVNFNVNVVNGSTVIQNGYTLVDPGKNFQGQTSILTSAPAVPGTANLPAHVIVVGAVDPPAGGQASQYGLLASTIHDSHNELNTTPNVGGAGAPLQFISNPAYSPLYVLSNPGASFSVFSPSVAAGGIQKIVDNSSPIPRDRVFLNYNYFDHTSIDVGGHALNVNRLTPGFEKTFADQRMSIEVRVPFATQVDNVNLAPGAVTNTGQILLGNQTSYFKALIYTDPTVSFAGGLGLQMPTAPDTTYSANGYQYTYATNQTVATSPETLIKVKNEAVHLLPYIGAVYTPNNHFFAQGVAQFDFSTTGNSVYNAALIPQIQSNLNVVSMATPLTYAGNLYDTNFMYLSGNAGYWIYKTQNPYERGVTGFAPTVELHYNQSLERQDAVAGYYGNVSSTVSNVSNVNGVIGANTVFGHNKYLSVAYVAPFTTGVNRFFDGELRVMFNYYFGAPRVNPRFANVPGQ